MPITDLTGTVWRFNSKINSIHTGPFGAYAWGTKIKVRFTVLGPGAVSGTHRYKDGYGFDDYYWLSGGTYRQGLEWLLYTGDLDLSTLQNKEIVFLANPTEYTKYSQAGWYDGSRVYYDYGLSDFLTWLQANAVQVNKRPRKVKINNKVLRKINNKNIKRFNLLPAMSGITKYEYIQSGSELSITNAPYSQSGTELTIE